MPWFEPASIFLGALGGTVLVLILIYVCIKKGLCFCDPEEGKKTTEVEAEYVPLATEEDGTDSIFTHSIVSSPPAIGVYEKKNMMAVSNPELASPALEELNKDAVPVSDDNESPRKLVRNKSQSLSDLRVPIISVSMQYSLKDLFLVVAINKVIIDKEVLRGCNQMRINGVILPDKKFRIKTRYVATDKPDIDVRFKFSNVSRNALFQSSLRLRLYARTMRVGIQAGRERCISEVTIHLADVAQREGALKTERPMVLKSSFTKK